MAALATAAAAIERLNDRYGDAPGGGARFLLFHRTRRWNEGEGRWMGWERKRGKIEEFNRLLRGATNTSFAVQVGKLETSMMNVRTFSERLARERALWRFGANGLSMSEDYEEAWGRDLQIQPLFGDLDGILRACPAIAAARGAERVESFLPHDTAVLAVARGCGFEPMEWGREAILFEKVPTA